uniref:Uncharacterized protein n=1 Tax=Aedes aegypti TaxID=7159 RepID=A0A6E8PJ89_AEDAE
MSPPEDHQTATAADIEPAIDPNQEVVTSEDLYADAVSEIGNQNVSSEQQAQSASVPDIEQAAEPDQDVVPVGPPLPTPEEIEPQDRGTGIHSSPVDAGSRRMRRRSRMRRPRSRSHRSRSRRRSRSGRR